MRVRIRMLLFCVMSMAKLFCCSSGQLGRTSGVVSSVLQACQGRGNTAVLKFSKRGDAAYFGLMEIAAYPELISGSTAKCPFSARENVFPNYVLFNKIWYSTSKFVTDEPPPLMNIARRLSYQTTFYVSAYPGASHFTKNRGLFVSVSPLRCYQIISCICFS